MIAHDSTNRVPESILPSSLADRFFELVVRYRLALLLALPVLALVSLLVVPLAILFQYSLYTNVPGKGIIFVLTLDNYVHFFTDSYFLTGAFVTLGSAVVVTLITLVVSYPVAYFYARSRFRFKGLLLIMLLAPFYLNIIVRIYGWMIILGRTGILNNLLVGYGILTKPYDFLESYLGLIIILVYVQSPIMVLSLTGPLQAISESLLEAAGVCGARDLKVFKDVILPLSIPGILSGSVLVFAATVAAFIVPLIVGGKIGFLFLSVMVYEQMNTIQNWAFGSAIAVILLAASVTLVTVYSSLVRRSKIGVVMSEKFIR